MEILEYDPRQCPLCGCSDIHGEDCKLLGKEHVYINGDMSRVDWTATFKKNGYPERSLHIAGNPLDSRCVAGACSINNCIYPSCVPEFRDTQELPRLDVSD